MYHRFPCFPRTSIEQAPRRAWIDYVDYFDASAPMEPAMAHSCIYTVSPGDDPEAKQAHGALDWTKQILCVGDVHTRDTLHPIS